VFTTAGSALSVGWLFIAASVPPALLSLVFGKIADRYDRRTLCMVADLASVSERRAGVVFGATNAAGLGLSALVTILVATIADHTVIANAFHTLAALTATTALITAATLRTRPDACDTE
jgi:MFS family permease